MLWLILNRPEAANGFNDDLQADLTDFLTTLDDPASKVKVVIVTGNGAVFSAGADLKSLTAASDGDGGFAFSKMSMSHQQRSGGITVRVRRCPQIFIAALNGAAAGAGFSLALACDLRIGTEKCKMNCAFINLGLTGCEMLTSWILPRTIGMGLASELMLTGRFLDAQTAFKTGLLSQVVPDVPALHAAAKQLANELCEKTCLQLRMTKECINAAQNMSLEATRHMEDRNQVLCMKDEECMQSAAQYAMRILSKQEKQRFVAKL